MQVSHWQHWVLHLPSCVEIRVYLYGVLDLETISSLSYGIWYTGSVFFVVVLPSTVSCETSPLSHPVVQMT